MRRSEMNEEQKERNDFLVSTYENLATRLRSQANLSKYQLYMAKSQLSETIALICHNARDFDLAAFHKNAANAYENKAKNLPLGALL